MLKEPIKTKTSICLKKTLKPKGLKKNLFLGPNLMILKITQAIVLNRELLLKINQLLNKIINKKGKIIFPLINFFAKTKKPIGVRMGNGKGVVDSWVVPLKTGSVLFYIDGLPQHYSKFKILKEFKSYFSCNIKLIFSKY